MRWRDVTWRPISTWPVGADPSPHTPRPRSPFSALWSDTTKTLERELEHLDAHDVVLELAFREQDFRVDGRPRAKAQVRHPGVVLSIGRSEQGPLRFATDRFGRWEDNLRAIALGMESLRRVDRYGITQAGEQYAGWRALPSSTEGDAQIQRGRALIEQHGGVSAALKATHPDHGGSREDLEAVMRAREAA